ncbi:MAG: hypothetical protein MJE68_00655 [Proteobacteria bacterium]|nr:hypothetical protein [Pseudomonadota bacterium]
MSHSEFNNPEGITRNCNDGNIIGRSIQVNMSTYESRLTILDYDSAFNGGNISCSFDSVAISEDVKPIGAAELMISGIHNDLYMRA